MSDQDEGVFLKNGRVMRTTSAKGVSGMILRSIENRRFFRVTKPDGSFEDFEFLHSDLSVKIEDSDAYFYRFEDESRGSILDHAPSTLGLGDDPSMRFMAEIPPRKPVIVKDCMRWQEMDGETRLIRMLNAYLTKTFVVREDVPPDECLSYALEIAAFKSIEEKADELKAYLERKFAKFVADEKPEWRSRLDFIPKAVHAIIAICLLERQR